MSAGSVWHNLWTNQSPSVALKEHFINLDEDIDSVKEEGRGAYGAVFEVKYHGSVCVAKRVLDILTGLGSHQFVDRSQYEPLLARFRAECDLLSKLRHPNIVQFLGIYQPSPDPRDITLVMEKLEIDLDRFIEKCKPISLDVKLGILCDVSAGLLHIHSHNVIHRDLSARNVLLTKDLRAKVADFGMSRILPEGTGPRMDMTIVPGALDYMAPEAIEGNYNEKLDTFSYGHLTLFLINEEYPSPIYFTPKQLQKMDQNLIIEVERRRGWIDKMGRDHILYQLVVECLNDEPEPRPTMNGINQRIAPHLNSIKQDFLSVSKSQSQLNQYKSAIMEMIQKLPDFFTQTQDDVKQSVDQDEFMRTKAELDQTRQQLADKNFELVEMQGELNDLRQQLTDKDNELLKAMEIQAELNDLKQQLTNKDNELYSQTTRMSKEIEEKMITIRNMEDEQKSRNNELQLEIDRLTIEMSNLTCEKDVQIKQLQSTIETLELRNKEAGKLQESATTETELNLPQNEEKQFKQETQADVQPAQMPEETRKQTEIKDTKPAPAGTSHSYKMLPPKVPPKPIKLTKPIERERSTSFTGRLEDKNALYANFSSIREELQKLHQKKQQQTDDTNNVN